MNSSRSLRNRKEHPSFLQEPKAIDLYFRVLMITTSLVELACSLDPIWTLRPRPLWTARERPDAADQILGTLRAAPDRLKIDSVLVLAREWRFKSSHPHQINKELRSKCHHTESR
jgi:hypothetical protein